MRKIVLTLILCAMGASASVAGLVVYDPFNDASSASAVPTGWTNYSGTTHSRIDAGSLSYAGLPDSQGNSWGLGQLTGDYRLTVSGITGLVAGDTVYCSFLLRLNSPLDAFNAGSLRLFNLANGQNGGISIGWGTSDYAQNKMGFSLGSRSSSWLDGMSVTHSNTLETYTAADTTYLIVMGYTRGTSYTSPGAVDLWINPAGSSFGGSAPASTLHVASYVNATDYANLSTFNALDWISNGGGSGVNSWQIDELRIGTDWASVVPTGSEPPVQTLSGLMFAITSASLPAGPSNYTLTVNGGTGDGVYTNGAQVAITADAPATGLVFDRWSGDTQYVNNITNASALVTMPARDVTLTSTYASTGYVAYSTAPYLQNMSSTGMVVMCEMPQDVPLQLEYGTTTSYGGTVPFLSETNSGGKWFCRALVTGLSPAQTYHYRVVQNTGASADATFSTSPTNNADFSFGVWSDSHGENWLWSADPCQPTRSMLHQMVTNGVAFGLSVGDLLGQGTNYTQVRNSYLDCVASELGPYVPWYIAWGNHDSSQTNAALRRAADLPSRYRSGFSSGHGSYTFTYANCFFVCIDEFQKSTINNGWLQQELSSAAAQQARFRIVAVHVPPYSERWINGDANLRSYLVPLMEQYDVDLCISGHVHEYERGETNGVNYVITGASCNIDYKEVIVTNWPHMTIGGAQDNLPGSFRSFSNTAGNLGPATPIVGGLVNEYCFVQVTGDLLRFECRGFNSDGSYIGVLDSFELQARPQP